jgi:hypothetical protein
MKTFQIIHLIFNNFLPENRAVYEIKQQNYSRARQAIDDNGTRRVHFSWWITKATNTFITCSNLLFCSNNVHTNAPQCYLIHKLLVLYNMSIIEMQVEANSDVIAYSHSRYVTQHNVRPSQTYIPNIFHYCCRNTFLEHVISFINGAYHLNNFVSLFS